MKTTDGHAIEIDTKHDLEKENMRLDDEIKWLNNEIEEFKRDIDESNANKLKNLYDKGIVMKRVIWSNINHHRTTPTNSWSLPKIENKKLYQSCCRQIWFFFVLLKLAKAENYSNKIYFVRGKTVVPYVH